MAKQEYLLTVLSGASKGSIPLHSPASWLSQSQWAINLNLATRVCHGVQQAVSGSQRFPAGTHAETPVGKKNSTHGTKFQQMWDIQSGFQNNMTAQSPPCKSRPRQHGPNCLHAWGGANASLVNPNTHLLSQPVSDLKYMQLAWRNTGMGNCLTFTFQAFTSPVTKFFWQWTEPWKF